MVFRFKKIVKIQVTNIVMGNKMAKGPAKFFLLVAKVSFEQNYI